MPKQRTIKQSISTTGIGLHSGQKVTLSLYPAPVNTGIVFRRIDVKPVIEIPARAEFVVDTLLATTIGVGSVRVATVEHLLSAIAALGIDNLFIDVDAAEIPIMDGSAAPFVFLIQSVGISTQQANKKFIRILKPIMVEDGQPDTAQYKYAKFLPYHGFKMDFTIEFDHPLFNGPQSLSMDLSSTSFVKEVSRARTFGFKAEYEWLRSRNLALGGSLDNAIMIDEYRIMNEGGLRYQDELVRHKMLDAVGDLSMLGSPLIGAFEGYKSGHAMNNRLLHAIMADKTAWEYVTYKKEVEVPICYAQPELVLV
ncbi:MAG: UDP-3-O-acyl-N-acetylglucosamine deacetylase [Gammaproteobacteria bacterium]|nr:UDP-3-O-acyl-N-acetylglucosamine deacetylase [Gammaproteobacteria bacterium]